MEKNQRVEELLRVMRKMRKLNFEILVPEISQGEFYLLATIEHIYEEEKEGAKRHKGMPCKMPWQMVGDERMLRFGVSYISGMMEVSPPAVSRTLGTLVDKGYVRRIIDQQDRRSICIGLTEKGHELSNKIKKRMSEFANTVFQIIGMEEMNHLCNTLTRLQQVMQDELEVFKGNIINNQMEGEYNAKNC